jgi:hypothetical protein
MWHLWVRLPRWPRRLSPFTAWLISKQSHEHEFQSESERRLFELRRELYEEALIDVFKSVAATNAWEIKLLGLDTPVPPMF